MPFGAQVATEKDVVDIIKAAFDAGINYFDCAEMYSQGKSESMVGNALKHLKCKRSDYVVSTKIFWGGKVCFVLFWIM